MDEIATVVPLCEQLVVRTAEDSKVGRGGRPALGEGLFVMELDPAALCAPTTVSAAEGTLRAIPRHHLTLDRERDVTAVGARPANLLRSDSRLSAHAEAALLPIGNQNIQRPLYDLRQVAIGQFMAHQVARLLQFVVELLTRSELHLVSGSSERIEPGLRAYGGRRLRLEARL